MPLMKRRSKKAFEHNVKAEMHAGKPQDQSLAIAYSIKRKAKKASGGTVESGSPDMNMTDGGKVKDIVSIHEDYPGKQYTKTFEDVSREKRLKRKKLADGGEVSANNEKRPMPENMYFDREEASRNAHRRDNGEDGWTDNPTVKQAQKNNGREVKIIKRPRMVPSNVFSTRMYDEEADLQSSAKPGPYGEQPPEHDNELDADSHGHPVRDEERQHNNGRKPYAAGGMAVEEDRNERRERSDEAHLQSGASPSEDEGHIYADEHNEEGPDRQGPAISDNEEPHSEHDRMYRDNMHSQPDDMNPADHPYASDRSDDQPDDESQLMHEASIAAAIMAKRRRMARGGAILSEDSMETTDDDQADLTRNAEEDANMEDKASFDALRKENYDEEDALRQADSPRDSAQRADEEESDSENRHDRSLVGKIRSNMKKRSPISR